jgi:GNAT superfamily N-acetyltransferase
MRIRPFEPRDEGDVLRMVRELYVDDPSPHALGDANTRRTLGVITDERRGAVWLADDGAGTPPFAYIFLTKVWSNELGGDLVFVDELWVARERRSRGVGSALVEHAIATTRGAVAFELEVTPANTRARALYERLGFRPLKNTSLRRVLALGALAAAIFAGTGSTPAAAAPTEFLVAERPGHEVHGDSYVLVLSEQADIDHARDLIVKGASAGATIAVVRIAAGADGRNRDVRAPGEPLWSWHQTAFEGFADFAIELCDGWPGYVEEDVERWIANTGGTICFWSYTAVEELPEPGAPGIAAGAALLLAAARRMHAQTVAPRHPAVR